MSAFKKFIVMSLVCFVLACGLLTAQHEPSKEDQEKMMKLWQKYMTPGDNHKYLEYFTGNWTAETTMWMAPGAPPQKSKGSVKAKMILGGRYIKSHMNGTMMGMPMEGIAITGYDNFQKKFNSFWIDTAGTGFYLSSGTLEGKVRTETGLWDDFMTGGKSKVKMVTKTVDDNKFVFEMFATGPDGKEFKTMNIVYTRKK